jgi:hypothetical protein
MATKSKAAKNRRTHTAPKTVLKLPDLHQAKSAVLNSLSSRHAQRGYRHAMDEFVEWYCSEPRLSFSRTVVLRYRMHLESQNLAPGTINLRLGAVRRLAYEAADCGLLSPDLAAGIRRVKGVKKLGVRLGNWLTAEQASTLWRTPPGDTWFGTSFGSMRQLPASPRSRPMIFGAVLPAYATRRGENWTRFNSCLGMSLPSQLNATSAASSGSARPSTTGLALSRPDSGAVQTDSRDGLATIRTEAKSAHFRVSPRVQCQS